MTRYDCGMVVAAQPEAVEAGASILRAGGNAVAPTNGRTLSSEKPEMASVSF